MGVGERSGIPHLTPALSAPRGGEGVKFSLPFPNLCRWRGFPPREDLRAAIGLWAAWLGGERRARRIP